MSLKHKACLSTLGSSAVGIGIAAPTVYAFRYGSESSSLNNEYEILKTKNSELKKEKQSKSNELETFRRSLGGV